MKSNECKEKLKQTMIDTYGVKHFSQTEEFKNKVIQTNLQKYGTKILL